MNSITAYPFEFISRDGLKIACSRWDNGNPPRGVIQIAHGMGEHIGRYLGLIEVLARSGLVVFGNDHRGHGRTALPSKRFGDLGPGGFNLLVEDMVRLSSIAREENPAKPFILLGHSMGSFAAQKYVLDHSDSISGLVLSGSGVLDGLAHNAHSTPPENILNAHFVPVRTPSDWLSRDAAAVNEFINDPLCFRFLEPLPPKRFWQLLRNWPTRFAFAMYAPICLFTCFRAAKIPSVSNSKESASSWAGTAMRVCATSPMISTRAGGMRCFTKPTAKK